MLRRGCAGLARAVSSSASRSKAVATASVSARSFHAPAKATRRTSAVVYQGRTLPSAPARRVAMCTNQAPQPRTRKLARGSHALAQHRETEQNKSSATFEFSAENKKEIEKYLKRYPENYKRSAVMPLLYLAQKQCGNWVPLAAMNKIAELLDMPPIRVYEVATFYTMYNREPVGKYHIQLCGTTPCQLCGAEDIRGAIEKELKIKEGQTTEDGLFTLSEVECLGACVNAPMIQVNNEHFYENLTPESMVGLLRKWAKGEEVKPGPQNGQKDCEGPSGRTTLKDLSFIKPVSRDFGALKQELEKAAKEEKKA